MKKLTAFAAFAAISAVAFATEMAQPPMGDPNGGFIQNLTDDQKACIEQSGCKMMEMKKPDGDFNMGSQKTKQRGEKPQRQEMTDEEKAEMDANRECMQKAFSDCGIEMPERPDGNPSSGEGRIRQ